MQRLTPQDIDFWNLTARLLRTNTRYRSTPPDTGNFMIQPVPSRHLSAAANVWPYISLGSHLYAAFLDHYLAVGLFYVYRRWRIPILASLPSRHDILVSVASVAEPPPSLKTAAGYLRARAVHGWLRGASTSDLPDSLTTRLPWIDRRGRSQDLSLPYTTRATHTDHAFRRARRADGHRVPPLRGDTSLHALLPPDTAWHRPSAIARQQAAFLNMSLPQRQFLAYACAHYDASRKQDKSPWTARICVVALNGERAYTTVSDATRLEDLDAWRTRACAWAMNHTRPLGPTI